MNRIVQTIRRAVTQPLLITPYARPGENAVAGHFFLHGKQPDGSYVRLTGLNGDGSRSTLQGKS